ncbi:hypothetical protein LEP1GSC047_2802 [Leptospira inadai serovar Lyme str. 10]|uniref:Uncharacterized protein n=1 Tax=Leptospira inadai serovar Lyme str. 10 TaxID=1049790 RepID=V6HBT1_9LEPT|nr:hypothetical protein LEP1GSC047_2802 [Leptospira inadai serovar Lyme str. 10]
MGRRRLPCIRSAAGSGSGLSRSSLLFARGFFPETGGRRRVFLVRLLFNYQLLLLTGIGRTLELFLDCLILIFHIISWSCEGGSFRFPTRLLG